MLRQWGTVSAARRVKPDVFLHASALSASIQQPLLLPSGCFHYMAIIQFPQSSLESVCLCVFGPSEWVQACPHSPITKADDGQLNKVNSAERRALLSLN